MEVALLFLHLSPPRLNFSAYMITVGVCPLVTKLYRVLPEKLTVSRLVEEIPEFCGTRRFITAFTSPHPEPDRSSSCLPIPLLEDPWSTVLSEKLADSQLLKEFPAFYGTRWFITAFARARHLSLS